MRRNSVPGSVLVVDMSCSFRNGRAFLFRNETCRQTPRKSAALKPNFYCRSKWKLLSNVFLKIPTKIIEFILFRAKKFSPTKIIESWTILNISELVFSDLLCSISINVKVFSYLYLHLLAAETFLINSVKLEHKQEHIFLAAYLLFKDPFSLKNLNISTYKNLLQIC